MIILKMVSLSMWNHSANIVECRLSTKAACTFAMYFGVRLVRERLALGSLSTLCKPWQNLPYHSKTFVRDRHSLTYDFCNILNVSVAVNSFLKENVIAVHCTRCVSTTTDEKNAYENIYQLHDAWSYNIKMLYPRSEGFDVHAPICRT